MVPRALALALLLASPPAVWAHGSRVESGAWWRAWNWDPLILLGLGLLAWLYTRGLKRLWGKVGADQKVRRWQVACYFFAWGAIFVALVSPLDSLSEELSSLHMVQHMLLMVIAAPLFVLGSPTVVLAWAFPEWRKGPAKALLTFTFRFPQRALFWQPLFLWTLFALTLWAWHHPVWYQAALRDPLVHNVQHLSFFVVACFFWRACLDPLSGRRLCPVVVLPYLFATSVHASALGVFLALSPHVWYSDYADKTSAWGFTPLQDQQLAGLIMWMPACLIYPAMAAILFGVWIGDMPRRNEARNSATGQKEGDAP
jgi:putative membrane protein